MTCPPDCGWCCTHLVRPRPADEAEAEAAFLDELRSHGVYRCGDLTDTGLSLTNDEAAELRAEATRRGLAADIHPRTFLLERERRWVLTVDWHLAHESCPFYADYKCTAYDLRPAPCRAYPVMAPGPRWRLAADCPRVAEQAWEATGERRAAFFRVETLARKALDARHAAFDEAFALTTRPDVRLAVGLSAAEALRKARTWTPRPVEELLRERGTS